MAQGWEQLRLGQDGRWQPTGQRHDQFPFRFVDFYSAAGFDVENRERKIFVERGNVPSTEPPLYTVGWAAFKTP